MLAQSNAHFVSVSCGDSHTLALAADGSVYACGDNSQGQLGNNNMGGLLSSVQAPEKIIAIACGNLHSVFLGVSGSVYTCGANSSGQLGQNHLNNVATPTKANLQDASGVAVAAGYMHTIAVTGTGDVRVFGFMSRDVNFGGLGKVVGSFKPGSPDRAVELSSGSTHFLVLTASGKVYGLGVNGHGQLGLGASGPKFSTELVPIPVRGGRITHVGCGFQHSMYSTDREVYGFGRNERSQLGNNATAHQSSPTPATLPQGFALRDVFCVSTSGSSGSSSTSSTTSVLPEETVELVLPERQFHQGFQSFNPVMVGVSSEESTLPPPSQSFALQKKQ